MLTKVVMSLAHRISNRAGRWLRLQRERLDVLRSMTLLHGPTRVNCAPDEAIAVCLVKDGSFFIREFIEHHQRMGIKHIVFVDNGSTDGTIEIAKQYPKVSIWQSRLPVARYERHLRLFAVERYCKGNWCLCVDIDELFDYPGSDTRSFKELLQYMNVHGYTAVVANLLDMFSSDGCQRHGHQPGVSFRETHRYYDVSNVVKQDYYEVECGYFLSANRLANPATQFFLGGIRLTLFGIHNGLTKHPLFRVVGDLKPITHAHCSSNAYCADFTAVLYHYKFAGDFYSAVRKRVQEQTWAHGEDEAYLKKLDELGELSFDQGTSRRLESAAQLIDDGFVIVSKQFEQWAQPTSSRVDVQAAPVAV